MKKIITEKIVGTKFKAEKAILLTKFHDRPLVEGKQASLDQVLVHQNKVFTRQSNNISISDSQTKKVLHQYQTEEPRYYDFYVLSYNNALLIIALSHKNTDILNESLELLHTIDSENKGYDFSVAIHKDSLVLSDKEQISHYDIATWKLEKQLKHSIPNCDPKLSLDGTKVAYADKEKEELVVCESLTGNKLFSCPVPSLFYSFAISSKYLVGYDQGSATLHIFDLDTGILIKKFTHNATDAEGILYIYISPNNKYILITRNRPNYAFVLWDIEQERCLWIKNISFEGNGAFTADSESFCVIPFSNRRFQLLDTLTGAWKDLSSTSGKEIDKMAYDSLNDVLYCQSKYKGTNVVIRAKDGTPVQEFFKEKMYASNNTPEVLLHADKQLKQINLSTAVPYDSIYTTSPFDYPNSHSTILDLNGTHFLQIVIRQSPTRHQFALYNRQGKEVLLINEITHDFGQVLPRIAKLSNNTKWAVGALDKKLFFWDIKSNQQVAAYTLSKPVTGIVLSPDNKQAITWDKKNHIYFWDIVTQTLLDTKKSTQPVQDICFDYNSQTMIVATAKNQLQFWDMKDRTPKGAIKMPESKDAIQAIALGYAAKLFVASALNDIYTFDISAYFEKTKNPLASANTTFVSNWDALEALIKQPKELLNIIKGANWDCFSLTTDTVPLRRILKKIEASSGVQEIHFFCSTKILEQNKRLIHSFGHRSKITTSALDSNQKWLATAGSVVNYEDGGELMIWEQETNRCVNILMGIQGGVGFPDWNECMCWNPQKELIGMAFSTNLVGQIDPFGYESNPRSIISVTDGSNRPPDFNFTADGESIIVYWNEDYYQAPLFDGWIGREECKYYKDKEVPNHTWIEKKPLKDLPKPYLDNEQNIPHKNTSPLFKKGKNYGNSFSLNPAFPYQKNNTWHWVIALENGLVYCPKELEDEVKNLLTFTIKNRYAWPVEWVNESHFRFTEKIEEIWEAL